MDIKSNREKNFAPITVELTIETEEEFEYFWALSNNPLPETRENSKQPELLEDAGDVQMAFFESLDKYRN